MLFIRLRYKAPPGPFITEAINSDRICAITFDPPLKRGAMAVLVQGSSRPHLIVGDPIGEIPYAELGMVDVSSKPLTQIRPAAIQRVVLAGNDINFFFHDCPEYISLYSVGNPNRVFEEILNRIAMAA